MEDQNPGSFEQMPEQASARSPAKKTKKAGVEARKAPARKTSFSDGRSSVPSTLSLGILLLGLALSAFNLWLMTSEVGSLNGLEQSWQGLLSNYGSRISEKVPEPEPAPESKEESVKLLYSVTDGESILPGLQTRLADPIVDYYKAVGMDLDAVLIERKQPLSKVVRVRLFFADQTETEFLWPYTGKSSDWWIPPCTLGEPTPDRPACPQEFLTKYPVINALMLKKKS